MRETLFNWLAPWVVDAQVLDAFAGTGALGFEALSRGSRHCDFVELNPQSSGELRRNVARLNASATVHTRSFLQWLGEDCAQAYNLVLIDPPFAAELWQASIDHIHSHLPLVPEARIYIESPKHANFSVPSHWRLSKQKSAGQTSAALFALTPPEGYRATPV